jgi:threonylcarbamoyladenosine tRNA methylthiotransferase MtaB
MKRFSIITLGCKVNQYDSAAIQSALVEAGFQQVSSRAADFCADLPDGRPAERAADRPAATRPGTTVDLVVVNTCCVTTTAAGKSRQFIRRAVRGAPGAAVLVCGCYCDYDAPGISEILADLGVDGSRLFLAGHHDDMRGVVDRLVAHLRGEVAAERPPGPHADLKVRRLESLRCGARGASGLGPIHRFPRHQRAFVKVQDGCDAFCAFCVVPYTRSRVWSRDIDRIERECRDLVAAGHKEIVLCGVFLGAFGRETAVRHRWAGRQGALPELIRRVAAIEGLWRVRLSSLEPGDVDAPLLAAVRELPNFAPHLHLPLQSGSPKILRRMNRQYTPDDFRRTVDVLRDTLDRPAITTDIMVGFPGETDEDFARTLDLARYAGFAKIHAFPFSPIQGTAAWTYRHEAPPRAAVADRMTELGDLETRLAAGFRRQFIGQVLEGIVENPPTAKRPGEAMTDRYQSVFFQDQAAIRPGQLVGLRILAVRGDGLVGELAGL